MSFSLEEIIADAKKYPLDRLIDKARASAGDENAAFAACYAATEQALGLTAFNEQLLTAKALNEGKIAELATGEGKTLAAVFSVYYNVLCGRNVHILTYNDYLAKRDYNWMKPIYDLLGVKIALITEKSTRAKRREAYRADAVYLTAKESGFDYLRDFVADDESETVHNGFDMAIVDEADSVLIDEARVPLVIAGNVEIDSDQDIAEISDFVKTLNGDDFGINVKMRTAYLTDNGSAKAEEHYEIDNIYEDGYNDLLTKINDCLKAQKLLKIDKDYIVRDNEIQLIDEQTGRVAKNRHYSGSLQAAVETLNGVEVTSRGTIMGTVALQFFLRRYKLLAGMTGTAESAKDEFFQLYNLVVEKIAPHVPSHRVDRTMEIYYDGESKWNAVVKRVIEAHRIMQPVLVGTSSIENTEMLEKMLKSEGIDEVSVLNAKNDEMEAEIIKNAGAYGRITISTNMAGRGVDIKLGGADEAERGKVVAAGGLLVIGTELAEAERINRQLMGRCGRQGDVGETRLFVALDDMIMKIYGLKSLIPSFKYPEKTDAHITDKTVIREVARIQRIAEGDTLDSRKRLMKFSMIEEKHREATFEAKTRYISGEKKPNIWQQYAAEEYDNAVRKFGEKPLNELQKAIILSSINEFWTEYLEFTDNLREGIHLTEIGGKSPTEEFNITCETYYDGMEEMLIDDVCNALTYICTLDRLEDYTIKKPLDTWTYLLESVGSELEHKAFLTKLLAEQETADDDDFGEAEIDDAPTEDKKSKGFFKSLFGKKKDN